MVGFTVTPRTPSLIRRFSSPLRSRSRLRLSYQTLCPPATSRCSAFSATLLNPGIPHETLHPRGDGRGQSGGDHIRHYRIDRHHHHHRAVDTTAVLSPPPGGGPGPRGNQASRLAQRHDDV